MLHLFKEVSHEGYKRVPSPLQALGESFFSTSAELGASQKAVAGVERRECSQAVITPTCWESCTSSCMVILTRMWVWLNLIPTG